MFLIARAIGGNLVSGDVWGNNLSIHYFEGDFIMTVWRVNEMNMCVDDQNTMIESEDKIMNKKEGTFRVISPPTVMFESHQARFI